MVGAEVDDPAKLSNLEKMKTPRQDHIDLRGKGFSAHDAVLGKTLPASCNVAFAEGEC
jgi:hypothetical protein